MPDASLCVYVCMCLCTWESEHKCECWCVLPHWKALLFTRKKLLFVFRYIISFVLFPPNCSCFFFLCSHRTCLRHLEMFLHLFLFFMVLFFYYICLSCLYSTLFITCGVSTSLANSHYFYWRLSLFLWLSLSSLFFHEPSATSLLNSDFGNSQVFLAIFWWPYFTDFYGWHIVILLLLNFIKRVKMLWQCSVDMQVLKSGVH